MIKNLRSDVFLIVLAAISWVLLTTYTFQLTAPGWDIQLEKFFHGDKILIKNLFLTCFFLFIFLFFKDLYNRESERKIGKVEWRVFSISLVCLFLHCIIIFLEHYTKAPFELAIWHNSLNNFNILIGTVFCANCFFYFKKLILFQRSNQISLIWRVFEYMIFASVLLTVFNVDVTEVYTFSGLLLYAGIALYLSTQMRWVAFLPKAKKVKAIFRFLVFFITVCLILQNFFFESFAFGEGANDHLLVIDCAHKFFLLSTFTFVSFYSISSILILLFNLPTSSAFEQKINDSNDYKHLSKTLHKDRDEREIYKVLLDTSLSTSGAKLGYVILNSIVEEVIVYSDLISKEEAIDIQTFFSVEIYSRLTRQKLFKNFEKSKISHPIFIEKGLKSALMNPIFINGSLTGILILFKDMEDGFEKESAEIINSYVLQASISIENRELLKGAIEHERYLEERKIAHSVKKRLLNDSIDLGDFIDVAVTSKSSDDVGGDFYDVFNSSQDKTIIVLGDVSGHGTSAAFNMAQLKGIFQTAVRNESDFDKIPHIINDSLYHCLENESFVTMSLFLIDKTLKELTHYRCGHNPSFYYCNGVVEQLKSPGIGLGMIQNEKFSSILVKEKRHYNSQDVLLCYTDGFVEARNNENEYFGMNGMESVLRKYKEESAQTIVNQLNEDLITFTLSESQVDDYSCIVIKF